MLNERIRTFLEEKGTKALKEGATIEKVMKGLEDLGGVDDDTLKGLKKVQLTRLGVKDLVAQAIVDMIKELTGGAKRRHPRYRDLRNATLEELANNVDPFDPDCPYARKIREKFGQDVPSVAIDDNQGLGCHRAATLEVLKNLQATIPISSPFRFQGKPYPLVVPGHKRPRTVAEHPAFPKVPLRIDGTDAQENPWHELPKDVKQVVRIIVAGGYLKIDQDDDAAVIDLFEMAKKGMDELSRRYSKAWQKWFEMSEDERPQLTMKVGGGKAPRRHPAHASAR